MLHFDCAKAIQGNRYFASKLTNETACKNMSKKFYYILFSLAFIVFKLNVLEANCSLNEITPYILPSNHPIKPVLDEIFGSSRVTANLETLKEAGFKIIYIKESSFVVIAKHPRVKRYIFKIYLDSETRTRLNKSSWEWLLNRCIGAERIEKLIKEEKIKKFIVAKKWLYCTSSSLNKIQHPVVLLATDMKLTSEKETAQAWKTKITTQHLDELYTILSHGYGSNFLCGNIPYTKSGKFAFIDTEYPYRIIDLTEVKRYISPELHAYWDQLILNGN